MIEDSGKRVCDKEIKRDNVWCGCRRPAVVTVPSQWVVNGLDYCKRHAGDGKGKLKTFPHL